MLITREKKACPCLRTPAHAGPQDARARSDKMKLLNNIYTPDTATTCWAHCDRKSYTVEHGTFCIFHIGLRRKNLGRTPYFGCARKRLLLYVHKSPDSTAPVVPSFRTTASLMRTEKSPQNRLDYRSVRTINEE